MCSNETLFIKISSGPDLAPGLSIAKFQLMLRTAFLFTRILSVMKRKSVRVSLFKAAEVGTEKNVPLSQAGGVRVSTPAYGEPLAILTADWEGRGRPDRPSEEATPERSLEGWEGLGSMYS